MSACQSVCQDFINCTARLRFAEISKKKLEIYILCRGSHPKEDARPKCPAHLVWVRLIYISLDSRLPPRLTWVGKVCPSATHLLAYITGTETNCTKYETVIPGVCSLEFGARPLGILSKGTLENTACPKVQKTRNSNYFSMHYRACRVRRI